MNKIYKVVRNALGQWVVGSELSQSSQSNTISHHIISTAPNIKTVIGLSILMIGIGFSQNAMAEGPFSNLPKGKEGLTVSVQNGDDDVINTKFLNFKSSDIDPDFGDYENSNIKMKLEEDFRAEIKDINGDSAYKPAIKFKLNDTIRIREKIIVGGNPNFLSEDDGKLTITHDEINNIKTITDINNPDNKYKAVNVEMLKTYGGGGGTQNAVLYDDNGKQLVTLGGTGATSETKITNLANGQINPNSTDAVNGRQIYELDKLNVKYDDTNKNTITLAGNPDGTKITQLQAGNISNTSKDAINGSQLNNMGTTVANALGGRSAYSGTSNTLTPSLTVKGNQYSTVQDALTALENSGSATTGMTSWNIADGHGNTSTVQQNDTVKITSSNNNLSAKLNATNKTVELTLNNNLTVKSVTTGNSKMDTNGFTTGNIRIKQGDITVGNNKINDVSDGDITATSTQAVNGKQIYELDQLNVKYDNTNKERITLGKDVVTPAGTTRQEATIDNLKDGLVNATSKEAVNGSQLHGLLDGLTKVLGGNAAINQVNNKNTITMSNIGNTGKNNIHDAIDYLNNKTTSGGYSFSIAANNGTTQQITSDKVISFNNGQNITVTRDGYNINIATKDDLTAKTVTVQNEVKVGTKEIVLNNDGIDMKNTDINNLKSVDDIYDSNNDHKAVNVETLRRNLNTGMATNTSRAIHEVNNRVNEVDKDARAGIAGALAASALPQSYQPGGRMTSIAFGNYKGASAIAIGHSAISDNGRHSFKFNANINSEKDVGVGMGYGYAW